MYMLEVKKRLRELKANKIKLLQYITDTELFLYLLKQINDYFYYNSDEYKDWKNDFDYHLENGY